jgi:thymidylate kinase
MKNRKLYITLEITGVIIWFLLKLLPRLTLFRNHRKVIVIADRYILDFAVMMAFTADLNNKDMSKIASFLEKFTGIKPLYFYIRADPYLALNRKKNEYLALSFCKYLASKYEYMNKFFYSTIIDTTYSTPLENVNRILGELRRRNLFE